MAAVQLHQLAAVRLSLAAAPVRTPLPGPTPQARGQHSAAQRVVMGTCAILTGLLDAGVSLTVIQAYLGHTNVVTTARSLQADQLLVATAVDAVERGWTPDRFRTFEG